MELFTTKDTKLSKRVVNESSKIADILNNKTNEVVSLQESAMSDAETKHDNMFSLAHDKKTRDKRAIRMEKAKFQSENQQELLEHFIFNVINEALLLDKDIKSLNKEYMTGKIHGIINHFIKAGAFRELPSATMNGVMESINYHIDSMFDAKDDTEKVKIVSESYMRDITTYIDYVSECVKNKVASVVKQEREISKAINESEKEFEGNDTLFRAIQMENVRMALKEENATEINEEVMAKAFCESIFDYTLMETLNTLRIVNLDSQQLRSGVQRFFKGTGVIREAQEFKGEGIKLYTLSIPKGTEEVLFQFHNSKEVKVHFFKDKKEVKDGVEIFFSTAVKDAKADFKAIVQEFKKEFRDARLSFKNPTINFYIQLEDDESTKTKL